MGDLPSGIICICCTRTECIPYAAVRRCRSPGYGYESNDDIRLTRAVARAHSSYSPNVLGGEHDGSDCSWIARHAKHNGLAWNRRCIADSSADWGGAINLQAAGDLSVTTVTGGTIPPAPTTPGAHELIINDTTPGAAITIPAGYCLCCRYRCTG